MDGRFLAALSRVTSDANTGVSDARKQPGKKCRKRERQRCNNDAAACKAQLPAACDNDPECVVAVTPCCETCSADGFLICLNAASASTVARFG